MSAISTDIPCSGVEEKKVPLKVALSSFLGNFIEWFDYATYTYFAITIGMVFFPDSAVDSTLMAFCVFALSFIFRPLGASFWGTMGDKKGRKWSLSVSILCMTRASALRANILEPPCSWPNMLPQTIAASTARWLPPLPPWACSPAPPPR